MREAKSAPITGSLGGIGFAAAKMLAGLGCDITRNASAQVIDARVWEGRASGASRTRSPT